MCNGADSTAHNFGGTIEDQKITVACGKIPTTPFRFVFTTKSLMCTPSIKMTIKLTTHETKNRLFHRIGVRRAELKSFAPDDGTAHP